MSDNMAPVSASAAMHAERLKAREAKRAKVADITAATETRQTSERYAERALAGARADEALRRRAAENDRRARAEREAADAAEADEFEEEGEDESAGPRKYPERRSAEAAHRGIVDQAYARVAREAQGYIA
ncbi:hypothetical protein AB0G87_32495 [Streptomyces asoensis]|uniref:hypothetical protein n=1 Tax=Streptomyces asoensis TaxID=249586 RepID=UPI0033F639B0